MKPAKGCEKPSCFAVQVSICAQHESKNGQVVPCSAKNSTSLLYEYKSHTTNHMPVRVVLLRRSDVTTAPLQRAAIAHSGTVHRHRDLTLPQPSQSRAGSYSSTTILHVPVHTHTLAPRPDPIGPTFSERVGRSHPPPLLSAEHCTHSYSYCTL
jgi:hypothetical protein